MDNSDMNLYDQIVDMFRNSCEWNYYERDIAEPFDSNMSKEFIKQYFENGAKKGVVLPIIEHIDSIRYIHTTSVYFIGLLIKRKLCPDLKIYSQKYDDYEFAYLWFLVCLFHDMGYAIENDWKYKFTYCNNNKEYFGLQNRRLTRQNAKSWFMHEKLGLSYVAPSKYGTCYCELKEICFNNGIVIKKPMYSRKTILNYLEYCKMTEGIRHYDHGIMGGFWLYDRLMQNYFFHFENEKNENPNINIDDFYVDGYLHFSSEQIIIYAYLADCIIAHNMWPATSENEEEYRQCGLEELIYPKYKRIKFEDNPILYILAIADTIEPIKTYGGKYHMKDEEIWKGIDINFTPLYIKIKIEDNRLEFEKMLLKVRGVENWLEVNVEINDMNKEIILEYL